MKREVELSDQLLSRHFVGMENVQTFREILSHGGIRDVPKQPSDDLTAHIQHSNPSEQN